MCRHVAYWGPPVALSDIVVDAPHPLPAQCTDAREMLSGCENLDGWGYGWFDVPDGRPHRYRTGLPMSGDPVGLEQLRHTESDRFVVHIRQKSPGAATDPTGSAPFWQDGWFFTHNGMVVGFRDGVREQLLARVSPARLSCIEGDADSEVLFALVLDRLEVGVPAVEAVRVVADVAREFGGRYNCILMNGAEIIATRWGNTLYVRENDAATIASEPLDDDPWVTIDDQSMLIVDTRGIRKETW